MSRNEIYDVSAELEKEFGAKGTPQREAAINHAWEEYNAQILLDARKNAGLTQAELAKRIGADKGYISRVERGLTIPTVATLYKIAAAMGMTVELRPLYFRNNICGLIQLIDLQSYYLMFNPISAGVNMLAKS